MDNTPLLSENDTPVFSYDLDERFCIKFFVDGNQLEGIADILDENMMENHSRDVFEELIKIFNAGREWERNKINRGEEK